MIASALTGIVDPQDAIERRHPLAAGLIGCWIGVSPLDGGLRWYDLAGANHANLGLDSLFFNPMIPRWAASNVGGLGAPHHVSNRFGEVFSGSRYPRFVTDAVWLRLPQADSGMILSHGGFAGPRHDFLIEADGSLAFRAFAGGPVSGSGNPAVPVGDWFMATLSGSSSGTRIYVNERLDFQTTELVGDANASSPLSRMQIGGNRNDGSGSALSCVTAAWLRYDRPLSQPDVAALYAQARLGWPDLLRWRGLDTAWFASLAAPNILEGVAARLPGRFNAARLPSSTDAARLPGRHNAARLPQ